MIVDDYLRLTRSAHRLERRSALNRSTLMATVVYTEMDLNPETEIETFKKDHSWAVKHPERST